MRLTYAIKYVADMDRAVAFHRDTLGLALSFESPFWSEFTTGDTRLALHPASGENPAGSVQLGFGCDDLAALYAARESNGLDFTMPPKREHGVLLARFRDGDGAECSISEGRG
jgi:catechol 2,3-dioxygenase-like lactoylglutathione lyase family enzyme